MFRLVASGVRGHILRFLLTACAVMLGVSFVAGTFVLRDSIDASLQSLFTQALKGLDVQVRGVEAREGAQNDGGGPGRGALPITLEKALAEVDGVARAAADVQGTALIAGKDGTPVRSGGAPGLGFAFRADDPAFTLVAGRAPGRPGEVAVERKTLASAQLAIGDRTRAMIAGQVREVTITGEVVFGSLFGATAVLIDEASARAAFTPDGKVSAFTLTAEEGVSQAELRDRVQAVLPAGAEAVTGAVLEEETSSALKSGLGFFTTFLLVFAGVALFVGSFIIVNTFSMLIAQRTRELALLRAIGASRGQVMRMVLGEAAVIGVLGSALGVGLGLLIVIGAKAGLRAGLGADIGGDLPLHPMTVVWSVLVGTVVTLLAATIPARRAARIAPVAAMRDDMTIAPKGLRLRGLVGGSMIVAGVALLAYSISRDDVVWPVAGTAAGLAVLGALVAAPLATRPVVRVITAPFAATGGVVGRLARENALRVPRRTANTASALMIGLALICALSVIAQSVKASIADIVEREVTSDFVLSAGQTSLVPSALAGQARTVPQVDSVAAIGVVGTRIGTTDMLASVAESTALADNFALTLRAGSLSTLESGQILLSQTLADKNGWSVGERVSTAMGGLAARPLTVGGIYADSETLGDVVVGRALYEQAVPASARGEVGVFVKAASGADLTALRAALTTLVQPYLVVSVEDGAEYVDSASAQIDTMLNLLYVLLLFSVVVAVLGIVNTLALSVTERTREIGLLRAVGLGRRQLAGMITIEAVATAVFGALLGAALGLGLGIALQRGLVSQGLDVLAVPWTTIGVVLVAASVVGVLAAVIPAVRAVRLNVLQAIATE